MPTQKKPDLDQVSFLVGVDWREGPPVPIPNTEVKLVIAENTCRATGRENRECRHEKTGIASAIPVFLLDHNCRRCTNRQARSIGLPVFNTWDTEQDQRRQESSFAPDMRRPRSLLHILSVMPWLSHGCSGAAAPKCAPETLPCRAAEIGRA